MKLELPKCDLCGETVDKVGHLEPYNFKRDKKGKKIKAILGCKNCSGPAHTLNKCG